MLIGVPKEIAPGETRVALIPAGVPVLTKMGHEIWVESGAGTASFFSDQQYTEQGAKIVKDTGRLYKESDVILKVQPPQDHPVLKKPESELTGEKATWLSFLAPLDNRSAIESLAGRQITSFAMEFVPRISRAQSMDALSSMATLAGYRAVLIGAGRLGKIFPLMMTAAGTVPPATVLVLGVGVAGLQAIATAKRLGAKVEAFDPRPAVKDQVKSVGAKFVEMELPEEDVETSGGYAKAQSDMFLQKEQEAIAARLPKVDVVITTAQIFGKKAPILISEEMVKLMPPGSVIIDLAAEQGGNCALTKAGETLEKYGVTIYGAVNLPATLPHHASQMYSKNITNLFRHIFAEGQPDFEDEITSGACLTRAGNIVNQMVADAFQKGEK